MFWYAVRMDLVQVVGTSIIAGAALFIATKIGRILSRLDSNEKEILRMRDENTQMRDKFEKVPNKNAHERLRHDVTKLEQWRENVVTQGLGTLDSKVNLALSDASRLDDRVSTLEDKVDRLNGLTTDEIKRKNRNRS